MTGKDTNPAMFTASTVVRYDQAQACLGLAFGDQVRPDRSDLDRFATTFHDHIEAHFLERA